MKPELLIGILIPLLGTVLGAATVFFLKHDMSRRLQGALSGFAAGVMCAASFFSLLLPGLQMAQDQKQNAILTIGLGFMAGMLFLLVLDLLVPHMHPGREEKSQSRNALSRSTKLLLAVSLHNLPEGMVVGVLFAGWLHGQAYLSLAGALALSVGIALQNFPEGAIVSLPLRAEGMNRPKTFLMGVLSGIIEPIGAVLTILFSSQFLPMLPALLAFAAGAMFYVVVDELVPVMHDAEENGHIGPVVFAVGFVLMMSLDVLFG